MKKDVERGSLCASIWNGRVFGFYKILCNRVWKKEGKEGNKYSAFLTMSRLFITNFSSSNNKKIAATCFVIIAWFFCIIYFSVIDLSSLMNGMNVFIFRQRKAVHIHTMCQTIIDDGLSSCCQNVYDMLQRTQEHWGDREKALHVFILWIIPKLRIAIVTVTEKCLRGALYAGTWFMILPNFSVFSLRKVNKPFGKGD